MDTQRRNMDEQRDLQALVDIMTCSVCLGTFQDPVTLKCGHIYCRPCIENARGVECPICKYPFTVEDFLTVYPTKELCEYLQNRISKELKEDEKTGKLYKECTKDETSSLDHNDANKKYASNDNFSLASSGSLTSLVDSCPSHDGEEIKFVCISCLSGLCAYCLYDKVHDGEGHKLKNLKDLLPQKQKDIRELSDIVANLHRSLVKRSHIIHDRLRSLSAGIKEQIAEFRNKINQVIDEYECRLTTSFDEFDPLRITKELMASLIHHKIESRFNGFVDTQSSFTFCIDNFKLEEKLRSLISSLSCRIENTNFSSLMKGVTLHNDWIMSEMESGFHNNVSDLKACIETSLDYTSYPEHLTTELEKVKILDNNGEGYQIRTNEFVAVDNKLFIVKEDLNRHVRLASISISNGNESPINLQHSQGEGNVSISAYRRKSDYLISVCRNAVLDEFICDPKIRGTLTAYRKLPNLSSACYDSNGGLYAMTADLGNPKLQQYTRHKLFGSNLYCLPEISLYYASLQYDTHNASLVITPKFINALTIIDEDKELRCICLKQLDSVVSVAVSSRGQYWILGCTSEKKEIILLLLNSLGKELRRWTQDDLELNGIPLQIATYEDQLIIMTKINSDVINSRNVKFVVFNCGLAC